MPIKKGKGGKGFSPLARRAIPAGGLVIGLAALLILGGVLFRPRPVWYVDGDFLSNWGRILRASAPPFDRFEPLPGAGSIPKGRYGYMISPRHPGAGEGDAAFPVKVFRDLARTREWEGAQALALNPWMVFRKHQDPEPDRERVTGSRGGEGVLVLPGGEEGAVWAWLYQLLQGPPGVFPGDRQVWEAARGRLFEGRRFQQGADTYSWVDIWPMLNSRETVWVYAPLSRVRALPSYRMGTLDATMFPAPEEWNIYGMQAEVLWAIPFGSEKQIKKMEGVKEWLRSSRVQTIIANTIDWIPAHPQGMPYNTISYESQMAWIRSSFIWQGAAYERRGND